MYKNIQGDFQIYISVPLTKLRTNKHVKPFNGDVVKSILTIVTYTVSWLIPWNFLYPENFTLELYSITML